MRLCAKKELERSYLGRRAIDFVGVGGAHIG